MQPAVRPSQKVPVMLSIVIGCAVGHLHSQPAMCSDICHDFTAQFIHVDTYNSQVNDAKQNEPENTIGVGNTRM